MPSTTWNRVQWGPVALDGTQGKLGLVGIPSGQTILRVRFGFSMGGTTVTSVVAPDIMAQPLVFGLVTTIGNGTESVPDPISFADDIAPPSQRWLWHERRWPTVVGFDAAGATFIWSCSPPQEPCDTHAQVLAPTGMGAGNTLNLWATWRVAQAWDASGLGVTFGFANVLVKVP